MNKTGLLALAMLLVPVYAFAVDGQVLINQSTVTAAGGFPYVISQPGSYKLSGNLTVPSGSNGIAIQSSAVTIDLNGFSITSLGFTTIFSNFAISAFGNYRNITIRSGSFANWTEAVILSGVSNVLVEDIVAQETFVVGGSSIANGIAIAAPAHSVLKRIVTEGQIQLSCPSIVTESIGNLQLFGGGCTTSTNAVP
jgi:hypothetical protein